jgi:hypothetical protein
MLAYLLNLTVHGRAPTVLMLTVTHVFSLLPSFTDMHIVTFVMSISKFDVHAIKRPILSLNHDVRGVVFRS